MSSASVLCFFGTCALNIYINVVISINMSYLGKLHNSIPIQCNDLVMHVHCHVETFFEYDVHELMLLQLSASSVVWLT
jgi:hypothetical protein